MISRTQLVTLHVTDLLALLGQPSDSVGELVLATDDGEIKVDLEGLCMTLAIEQPEPCCLPFSNCN